MADVLRSGEIERAERKAAELNAPAELAPAEVSPETGAPAEPELLLRVTRIRSALADLQAPKREQATLFSILFVLASQLFLWWPLFFHVPGIDLYRLYEAGVNILRSSSAYSNYDFLEVLPTLLLLTPVFLSSFVGLIAYGVLDPLYTQQIRFSNLASDFVQGRLDVNDVVRAAQPRLARWHRLIPARYVDEEVGLLFREADWFLAPRQNYWRLAWLSTPAAQFFWIAIGVLSIAAVTSLSWPALNTALDVNPGLGHALEFLFLTPVAIGLLLMAITYPSQLWRDLHWRAWHAPLRKAIMIELDRLDPPTPRPPQPYEVHTISTLLGLRKPEIVDPNRPREEPDTTSNPDPPLHASLARRLRFSPTAGVEANPAVPWALWAAPNALWLLSWNLTSFDPALAPSVYTLPDAAAVLLCGLVAFILLPLGLVIWEARLEQLAVRRYLQQSSPELRLAAALDTLHNSESRAVGRKLLAGRGEGTIEEGLRSVARELGTELKHWPHQRLPQPSALICGLLGIAGGFLLFVLRDWVSAELIDWLLGLLMPILTLVLVPAAYRRRMILDELTQYMQRSLAWDGEDRPTGD